MASVKLRALIAAASALLARALNNGVGTLPQLGFNSWYALHSHLTYPGYEWEPGFVLADAMVEIAGWMTAHGLDTLGYTYMNVDDCIVVGRDPVTGTLIPDPQAFPNGVRAYTQALNGLGYRAGFYSDRGNYTCSCYAGGLKRPGSRDHEAQDAATWAAWGLEEIKVDSCNDPGVNNTGALQQYALLRDGLNATAVPVLFDICWGAGATIAAPGRSLGNEWRIDEDDGSGWAAIMQNVYTDAGLSSYSGCEGKAGPGGHGQDGLGCGWNDPGLLMVGAGALTPVQSQSHMSLWSMLASKLLISVDPRSMEQQYIAMLSNPEVVAIDQDGAGVQAVRLVPPSDPSRVARDRAVRSAYFAAEEARSGVKIPRTAKYSTVAHRHGAWPEGVPLSRADVVVPGTEAAEVAAAGGRPEVWWRPLANGDAALLLFNNNMTSPSSVNCTGACFAALGFPPTATITVRDVWARTDNGTTTNAAGVVANGLPTDGVVMLRLSVAHTRAAPALVGGSAAIDVPTAQTSGDSKAEQHNGSRSSEAAGSSASGASDGPQQPLQLRFSWPF